MARAGPPHARGCRSNRQHPTDHRARRRLAEQEDSRGRSDDPRRSALPAQGELLEYGLRGDEELLRQASVMTRRTALGAIAALALLATASVAPRAAGGAPLLRLPLVSSNVATLAGSLQHLEVADSNGELTLATRDDPPGGLMYFRHWHAARAA